jgi:hypothetical protein
MTFGQGLNRRADGVTTHRKTLVRAGVAAVVALGALVVAPPAYAAPGASTVQVSLGQLADFAPGQTQSLSVTVTLSGGDSGTNPVNVALGWSRPSSFTVVDQTGCDGGGGSSCRIDFGGGSGQRKISFSLKAPASVDPGQSKTEHGTVTAQAGGGGLLGGGGPKDSANFDATVKGSQPTQAPTVTQLTGTVKDSTTGSPVKNAVVMLVDGGACAAGKPACQTGTDNQGAFKFAASAGKPITPGTLQIGAMKNGYENLVRTVDAQAGQSVTVTLALKPAAGASASASPDAVPTAEGQAPTADAAAPTAAAPKAAANSGTSTLSWVILVLALLLVLAGVGVFVMMFLNRRKRDAEDADEDGNPPSGPPGGGAAVDAGRYGGAADPTMVGQPGMAHAGMGMAGASDATAIIRPARPEDEFPDPYAAPYPTNQPGYPQSGDGYGGAAHGGAPTQVGSYAPGQPAGYDPGANQGYGGAPAGYGGEQQQGYGGAPAGYGGEQQQGYGGAPAGYGGEQQQGYGGAPAGYGAPGGQAPRYDEATGHWDGNADGYPPQGGQPQQGGHPQQGGYEQQQHGGYDQRGGYDAAGYPPAQDPYHQEEPPPPPTSAPPRRAAPPAARGGDRQRLDWLDD